MLVYFLYFTLFCIYSSQLLCFCMQGTE